MNRAEYERFKNEKDMQAIHIFYKGDLKNTNDHTLLYGYNFERDTVHIYFKDSMFHIICYTVSNLVYYYKDNVFKLGYSATTDYKFVHTTIKRVYPQCCSAEFYNWLQNRGIAPIFTKFEDRTNTLPLQGKTLEDFKEVHNA